MLMLLSGMYILHQYNNSVIKMEKDFLYHCQHIRTILLRFFHVWFLKFIFHSVNTVGSTDPFLLGTMLVLLQMSSYLLDILLICLQIGIIISIFQIVRF